MTITCKYLHETYLRKKEAVKKQQELIIQSNINQIITDVSNENELGHTKCIININILSPEMTNELIEKIKNIYIDSIVNIIEPTEQIANHISIEINWDPENKYERN